MFTRSNFMSAAAVFSRFSSLLVAGLLLSIGIANLLGADFAPATTHGDIFTETNGISMNLVNVYSRSSGGTLKFVQSVSAQGTGTGGDLKSQGAIAIGSNHKFLYAVDAGSNEITAFSFGAGGLKFIN